MGRVWNGRIKKKEIKKKRMKELASLARRRKRQSYEVERKMSHIGHSSPNGKSGRRSFDLLRFASKKDRFPREKSDMKRVTVRECTMEAFQQEFRSLKLPTSIECLVTHWKDSRLIRMCHDDDDSSIRTGTNKEVAELLHRITPSSSFGNSSSRSSSEKSSRRYLELREALDQLVTATGSLSERVTCWEDAQYVLSCVVTQQTEKDVQPPKKRQPKSVWTKCGRTMSSDYFNYMTKVTMEVRKRTYLAEIENWTSVEHLLSQSTKLTEEPSAVASIQNLLQKRVSEQTRKIATMQLKEDKKQPKFNLPQISPQEQQIVKSAFQGSPNDVVATCPKGGGDQVSRHSILTLRPKTWLNDEVIHYFCQLLSYRDEAICASNKQSKRSHFFKSFFMTKLLDQDGTYQYNNVKRWSKRVPGKDIFNLNKIFFPVNIGSMHWTLAVIHMTERKISFYDSMSGPYGKGICQALFRYIQDEWNNKKSPQIFPEKHQWILEPQPPNIPQQENCYDCGVFTCMYADLISRNIPLLFTQEQITACREHIALSILQGNVKK